VNSSNAEIPALELAAAGRSSFDPPAPQGQGRAFALALLAHLLLVLALAWGLYWKNSAQDQAVEAELWSATAQLAAPKAAPVPPPPPAPVIPPTPTPPPEPKPVPQVQDDSVRQAEIALEQQKKREEEQRQAKQALAQEQQRKAEKKRLQAEAAAKAQAAQEKAAKQQAQAEQAKAEARHQAEVRRMTALANADQASMVNSVNGQGKTPGGHAPRDSGPSAGYGARVRARVRPNITYADLNNIRGNPEAEVEIRTLPDGTIVGINLTRPSGVPSWDNAVQRAIEKTQIMPRDVDGRVPSPITIVFTPH
jgi:colicin import membrane protein